MLASIQSFEIKSDSKFVTLKCQHIIELNFLTNWVKKCNLEMAMNITCPLCPALLTCSLFKEEIRENSRRGNRIKSRIMRQWNDSLVLEAMLWKINNKAECEVIMKAVKTSVDGETLIQVAELVHLLTLSIDQVAKQKASTLSVKDASLTRFCTKCLDWFRERILKMDSENTDWETLLLMAKVSFAKICINSSLSKNVPHAPLVGKTFTEEDQCAEKLRKVLKVFKNIRAKLGKMGSSNGQKVVADVEDVFSKIEDTRPKLDLSWLRPQCSWKVCEQGRISNNKSSTVRVLLFQWHS